MNDARQGRWAAKIEGDSLTGEVQLGAFGKAALSGQRVAG